MNTEVWIQSNFRDGTRSSWEREEICDTVLREESIYDQDLIIFSLWVFFRKTTNFTKLQCNKISGNATKSRKGIPRFPTELCFPIKISLITANKFDHLMCLLSRKDILNYCLPWSNKCTRVEIWVLNASGIWENNCSMSSSNDIWGKSVCAGREEVTDWNSEKIMGWTTSARGTEYGDTIRVTVALCLFPRGCATWQGRWVRANGVMLVGEWSERELVCGCYLVIGWANGWTLMSECLCDIASDKWWWMGMVIYVMTLTTRCGVGTKCASQVLTHLHPLVPTPFQWHETLN